MVTQNQRAGFLYAIAGFTTLACGDAVVKSMAGQWSPVAVAALRFAIAAFALSAVLAWKEGKSGFVPAKPWLQVARGACVALGSTLFFAGIFLMPLAEATAISFVSPIYVALLSGPLLGERVRKATYLALAMAFGGVLIVLRPNIALVGWAALFPVASAFFIALLMIGNRASAGQGSGLSMQAFVALAATPILVIAAALGNASGVESLSVAWPAWHVIVRCAIVAASATAAHWLIYMATQRAGASTIAPASYVQILVSTTLGYVVYDHIPDVLTLIGVGIIICAGLVIWRDGKNASKAA